MSNNKKIIIKENKTLNLNNVLIRDIRADEVININKINYNMEEYVKLNKSFTVEFLINYSKVELDKNGGAKINLKRIFQLKNSINNIEYPYKFKRQIEEKNCLFARFCEKEENLKFAFQKLWVYAFENNIQLEGKVYTVFIKKDKNNIMANIFMK